MSVVLAATWSPRGEAKRLRRLYPQLASLFAHMVVVVPPNTHFGLILSMNHYEKLDFFTPEVWPAGRYESLRQAVRVIPNTSASHVMYADMDRLLRWTETRYNELRQSVKRVQMYDCLVLGRTKRAYATHPQALIQTEAVSNKVFSHLLGLPLDLSAGAKGFSREITQFIVRNARPENPFGADAEWVVLAKRGGCTVRTLAVHGLDWESADRYTDAAADENRQRVAADEYDADPKNWEMRVRVADEIIKSGLSALERPLVDDVI